MLDFLQISYNDSKLEQLLAVDYSTFRRSHTTDFEHFTNSQKELVEKSIRDVVSELAQGNKTLPQLQNYITLSSVDSTR